LVNHYDTLEVSRLASPEVIRAAYRSLMQRFHPDRNPTDSAAATRAAHVAVAYEVLSDPHKRASYDASLQAASLPQMPDAQHDPGVAPRRPPYVRTASAPRGSSRAVTSRFEAGLWLLVIVATAAGIFLSRSLMTRTDPAAELAAIRLTIESDATAEAEKRRLYARKLAILEQNPGLQLRASAERSEDMAGRTFPLLASPLVIHLSPSLSWPGRSIELTLPAASLLVGSFDAPNLLAHMARHRERLAQDVAVRLAKEDPDTLSRPDAEGRLKRIVAEVITASLEIGAPREYPSTYFDSPGAYGVVDVVLPDRFRLTPIESTR
jgi:curved DNA-binding protein CbpA